MNENQFEQLVAQMLTGMKSSTDWLLEAQRREYHEHQKKLDEAEAVLRKALDFVVSERARLRSSIRDAEPRQLGSVPPRSQRG